jgi:hypothetical protein
LALALLTPALGALAGPVAALDWIPPRPIVAVLPSATLAPSSTHSIELYVLASGPAASIIWAATTSGQFPITVTPSNGSLSLGAGGSAVVPISVTLPDTANGVTSLNIAVSYPSGPFAGRAAGAMATIFAATGGRPEVIPVPGTWAAAGGTSGNVGFQIHSLIGSSESVVLTTGRFNSDPNNDGSVFAGSSVASPVTLPAGGTITVNAPTTLATNAYAGNLNAIQLSVTSSEGISTAVGHALVNPAQTASLPTTLVPAGLTPADNSVAGRDGPALLASRGYWLVPSGLSGVGVMRATATDTIGTVDSDGDGVEDRWVGNIHIPSFAAAIDVIPGFVSPFGDTLDVGLLAAGRAGLMLLDLRVLEDPPFGTWSDFFDTDGNGIDDRILRIIPLSGFATDVTSFRTASGRWVAMVAAADTGSVPVSSDFNPAAVVAGTGQGVVAIDVAAALDTLSNPPYGAGTLATPGNALDLELRGGSSPDLAIADGGGGLSVYGVTASGGVPATLTFTLRGTVALSSTFGTAYARDAAWISNTKDSVYVAVAAGAGGLQFIRVPKAGGGAPSLVLVQQTASPDAGVAGTWTGTLAAAETSGGVALLRAPGAGFLDRILPAASPPYTAPVTLPRGAAWAATGAALELATHQTPMSSATALRFKPTSGPIPNLLVSDGPRLLSLRPGQAAITAVEAQVARSPATGSHIAIAVRPNPMVTSALVEIRTVTASSGAGGGGGVLGTADPLPRNLVLEVFDVRGRAVRRIQVPLALGASVATVAWDGRNEAGQRVSSGRYWMRARSIVEGNAAMSTGGAARDSAPVEAVTSDATPILIVR